jgi:hypothetical protein
MEQVLDERDKAIIATIVHYEVMGRLVEMNFFSEKDISKFYEESLTEEQKAIVSYYLAIRAEHLQKCIEEMKGK